MARSRKKVSPSSADPVTAYALDVKSGRIVAGPHVRTACDRHLRDLVEGPKRGLVWDVEEALKTFEFYSDILRLAGLHAVRALDAAQHLAFAFGQLPVVLALRGQQFFLGTQAVGVNTVLGSIQALLSVLELLQAGAVLAEAFLCAAGNGRQGHAHARTDHDHLAAGDVGACGVVDHLAAHYIFGCHKKSW